MKKKYSTLSGPVKNIMNPTFITVKKNQNVSEVQELLKKKPDLFEVMDYIYVISGNKELIGVFSIKDLFRNPPDSIVESFMITKVVSASANTETEKVADMAIKHGIKAIPIIKDKKIIGVLPNKDILKILNKSLRKDIFHFAGIHKSHLEYENTMDVPLMKSVLHRAPWLIGGLIGMLAIAAFIGLFENTLRENLIIASFIPVIVYICGALCTQIETLLVRDLAVLGKELKTVKYFVKQWTVSSIIALTISILLFLVISLFWGENRVAFVISLAAFLSLVLTTMTSFSIVLTIKKVGGDPALGGGPFGTVISDSLAIVVYILVASALL